MSAETQRTAGEKSAKVVLRIAAWLVAFVAAWLILDYGQPLLMPFVLALFTSILIFPIVKFLVRIRVPGPVAIAVSQVIGFMPIVGFLLVFLLTVGPVSKQSRWYAQTLQTQITKKSEDFVEWLNSHELFKQDEPMVPQVIIGQPPRMPPLVPDEPKMGPEDPDAAQPRAPPSTPGRFSPDDLRREFTDRIVPTLLSQGADWAQSLLGVTTVVLMNLFLVVLFTTFILIEGARFAEKSKEAFGDQNAIQLSLVSIAEDVRTYLVAKTLISALTGLLTWIFLTVMEVDFAGFWGLTTFALNYIPNVGSIAAAIPPILISLLNYLLTPPALASIWNPIMVAVGLLAIQTIIGSFFDPRLVGASLKLSPFVILISMLTWGLLWGPIGMILSVPIMVCFKIICSHVDGLQSIATMMKA